MVFCSIDDDDDILFPGEERRIVENKDSNDDDDIESKHIGRNNSNNCIDDDDDNDDDVIEFPGEKESLKYGNGSAVVGSVNDLTSISPKKTCMHRIFDIYRFIAAFAAFNMSIGVLVSLCLFDLTLIEHVIQVFLSVICVFIALSEVIDDNESLDGNRSSSSISVYKLCSGMIYPNWIARGTLYIFLGVIGISQWELAEDHEKLLVGYICVASWMMIVSGTIYVISGIFCCQRLKENCCTDHKKRYEHSLSLKKKLKNRGGI